MRKLLTCLAGLLLLLQTVSSQTAEIKGKVTDPNGNPVPGVSIQEKSSRRGTTTDMNGLFTLSAKTGTVLIFSSVGFDNKQVVVDKSTTLSIALTASNFALSEVVVTGVGAATSKKKLAFAVESVNLSSQVKVPTGDVAQQLVGQIAGAQISSTNGSPGRPLNILLRGINSLNRSTVPMILMDGLQVGVTDLTSLDLNIIDRVEVVEGAAASSIYGAQGANGVIQLFTKKAKGNKFNIDFSSSASSTELLNIGKVHQATLHAFTTDASNNVIGGSGNPITLDPATLSYSENVQYSPLTVTSYANKAYGANFKYYDNYKRFFQTGYALNNSLSISGTKDKVDFLISGAMNAQNSNFKDNGDYKKYNLTSNIGVELLKGLKFRSITQLVYTKNTLNDATGRGIVYNLNNTRPFVDYEQKDLDGNYGVYYGGGAGVNGSNPNYYNQYSSTLDNKIDIIQTFNLNYKVNRFVELDAKYGLNYQTDQTRYRYEYQGNNKNSVAQAFWTGGSSGNTAITSGEIDDIASRTTYQNLITTATIRTDFEKDFHIKIPIKTTTLVAYDFRKNLYNYFYAYGLGAPSYTPWNASQSSIYKISNDYTEPAVTYGYLVTQRFDYGDIAGISGGFRSDYSSAFGRGAEAQIFPHGDAYINISKFKFWETANLANTFTDFKIRAAYGEAGIQPKPFDRFPVLGASNLGSSSVFKFPTSSPNPDLQVEISKEKEIGVDLGFHVLKGDWIRSMNLSVTYWDRSTNNAIYNVDAAPSTGLGTVKNNAFSLGSHGIQASLNLNIHSSKTFTWDFTALFSNQTSKILSVIGQPVVITSSAGSSNYILRAGEKIGQLYGYLMLHSVDQADPITGQPLIAKANQPNYEVASNGWVVNTATKQPYASAGQYSFGDPNPKFNMGFINNLSYKGLLSFSMQWDWVNGSHLYNQTKSWMYRDGIHGDYTIPISIAGNSQAYTAFYRGVYQAGANNGTKNYFYEDASFWRLRNISLALDFAKVFKIKAFQRLQLVVSGRNLITSTKYTGYDPEVSSGSTNSAFDRGVDHNTIPNTKQYQVGLNVGL
jgi:TonB-dependent starch-binding outer membrane protein SusC